MGNMNTVYRDLKLLVSGSVIVLLAILGVMFFSPLSLQFYRDDVSRAGGGGWEIEIDRLMASNQLQCAFNFVDSLVEVISEDLPRFAYFDRFLSEEEHYEARSARADIYYLQWKRIEILSAMNRTEELREALEDYVKVIGYNRDEAKIMLNQLNDK